MSLEQVMRKDGSEKPFIFLNNRPIGWMDEDTHWEITQSLDLLGLNKDSTTETVRKLAVSSRSRMNRKGLNIDEVKALRFALYETGDCVDDKEFMQFLLNEIDFDQIEANRH